MVLSGMALCKKRSCARGKEAGQLRPLRRTLTGRMTMYSQQRCRREGRAHHSVASPLAERSALSNPEEKLPPCFRAVASCASSEAARLG